MKYYGTNTSPVNFRAFFETPKGVYTLTSANYTAQLHTRNGELEISSGSISVIVPPTASVNGKIQVSVTVPSTEKGGLVSIELLEGSPKKSVGVVTWYLLDNPIEYTSDNTTSIQIEN
jgi:hypothetical protein